MHHSSVCAIHYQYTIGTLHTIDMIYTLYIRDIYVILDLYGDYKVATYTAVCIKLSVYSLLSFCSTYNTRDTTTPQSRTGLWRSYTLRGIIPSEVLYDVLRRRATRSLLVVVWLPAAFSLLLILCSLASSIDL